MMSTGYRKRVTFILFALLLVRFWLGQTFELTEQEAYVWLKGKHLAWGYWDQGPLVPFLSFLGTTFFGQTELGVRWIASVIYCASGFLLFYTTRQWFSARVALYALILFIVMPLYCWQMLLLSEATVSVGLMAVALLFYRHVIERGRWDDWFWAGIISAVAVILSWWNIFWPAGLLLFRLIDGQRRDRWLSRQVVFFMALTLLGFVPFLRWHFVLGTLPVAAVSAAHWMAVKQYVYVNGRGPWVFLRDQAIWLGFGGLIGLGVILARMRHYAFLMRPHLFLLSLAVPGLAVQFFLSFFRADNLDVLAALYFPLLSLAASVGTRMTEDHHHRNWRWAALAMIVIAAAQSLSGLIPASAAKFWTGYAPNSFEGNRGLAIEVARMQRDNGASFVIVRDPRRASVLSFYLPLQPFVYVVPQKGIHNQFDLWPSYFDFEVTNAFFITKETVPPEEIGHQFEHVLPLQGIPIPAAKQLHFFLCERLVNGNGNGNAKSESEP